MWVEIEISKSETNLKLVVTDNGVGIEKPYQDRVFEMFFRANQHSFGSGLGLYLTKEIIYMLGGNLSLKSTPGVGTKITANLPYPLIPVKQKPAQIS